MLGLPANSRENQAVVCSLDEWFPIVIYTWFPQRTKGALPHPDTIWRRRLLGDEPSPVSDHQGLKFIDNYVQQ